MVAEGGSSFSLLYYFFFLCFLFVLSTIFFPLCGGLGRCSWWQPRRRIARRPMVPNGEEREARERGYCSSLYYLFFCPLYYVLFPFLLSPASIFHSLFPWFCWRLLPVLLVVVERKKQWWCPGVRMVFLLLCAKTIVSVFPSPCLFSLLFLSFLFLQLTYLFSPKKILPPLLLFPCIYRQLGERFTIPCPSVGYGGVGWLLCSRCRAWPSSSFVMVARYGGYG